ncbi:MAG: DNA repair protein [Nitrosomonadales bacterium SCN 54-20]|nr:MAG: DNA repair protein [Nitrosomonadales bacterium SCN 54-20]
MSAIPHSLQISFPEVVVNRIAGLKAGDTVVTPNRRLAATLKHEFDRIQAAQGISAWVSADILPASAFIERIYEDGLYSTHASHLPQLLTAAQEQLLWEEAIARSVGAPVLLSVAETARLAREAWVLAHEWQLIPRLGKFVLNEDCRAFSAWSRRYENVTRKARQIDRARLCTLVTGLCGSPGIAVPQRLICYGFDSVTPQWAALLAKLEEAGCEVDEVRGTTPPVQGFEMPHSANRTVHRVECDVSSEEIYRAAVWARARIERDSAARVGIVVPPLSEYRSSLVRIFSSVMEPDVRQALPGAPRHMPFNISLGIALGSYPLVHAAFLVLELIQGEIEFECASLLLRSPFLAGAEAEMLPRGQLDAKLRKHAEPVITLDRLLGLVKREKNAGCPVLVELLSACEKFCKKMSTDMQRPSALARAISDILRLVGFPGERTPDSSEYQTLKKWQDVLAGFALLDNVTTGMSYRQAVSHLRGMAADTLFQPETPDVPIQILGVFEAAGMMFDHLWVMGLSDEAWPLQPRPNPFLPIELQRTQRLPLGSPAATLELASRFTDGWLAASQEVILSHARHIGSSDTRELAPSPLIAHIAASDIGFPGLLPEYVKHRDLIHQGRRLERIKDDPAPGVVHGKGDGRARGGVAVIKDQAACPFRALALHRLQAEGLKTPHSGLDAAERGSLIHEMLAQVWGRIRDKSALDALAEDELKTLLTSAAGEVIARMSVRRPYTLSERLVRIEQRRLIRLAREWLEEERKRSDFTVISTEAKRSIEIAGLALSTRLDRVDELADGRRIVIDYKTRAPSVNAMLGERPDEPQLPLYLVAAEAEAAAIAFAQIRTGEMGYTALARDNDLLPGVKGFAESRHIDRYDSWEALVAAWSHALAGVAADFSSGHSQVDPKKYPQTCRTCDVRPLCRIYERAAMDFTGQGEEE